MSIFEKIFGAIGHFFSNLFTKAKPFLEKEIPAAIEVLNGLKQGVDLVALGPFKDALQKVLGAGFTDIAQKISDVLPKIVTDLGLSKGVVDQTNPEAVLLAALDAIKQIIPTARAAYYSGIATLLVQALADGKLDYNEALIIVNKAYQDGVNLHVFNDQAPAPTADQPADNPSN